ncbi:MAG: 1,4-dihydroxy-2-naphthoate octaprenyltransferase [Bacteroidota bacterium]
MNTIKKWILATRLETGTLAITSVALGSALAAFVGAFNKHVALLAALTAALLQLVCNLANDYGDWVRGADPINDIKLPSAIQTGLVTLEQAKRALWVLTILALASGVSLLYVAQLSLTELGSFLLLGVLALVAAITYTMGHRPYGYDGWGDVAVFVFFGLVGVGGTFYLHTKQLSTFWLLPAISHGSLVVGVLNINNLRDIAPDAQAGKRTLAVQWGQKSIIRYHWLLLIISLGAALAFWGIHAQTRWPYGVLLVSAYLLSQHGLAVSRAVSEQLNQQLQHLVLLIMLLACCWIFMLRYEAMSALWGH